MNSAGIQRVIEGLAVIDAEAASAKAALAQFTHDSRPNLNAIGSTGRFTLPAHHADMHYALTAAYERAQRCQAAAASAKRALDELTRNHEEQS